MKGAYRSDIDGLRAIAVIAVIGFHAFPDACKGGFVGVDVFFVISGYLITGIILRQLQASTFRYTEFYARRIRRIFPALAVLLLSCLLAGWFVLFPDEYRLLGKHVASGAGFILNVVLWREAGYFDRAEEFKPLLHLWSLGVEEQFYVIWPLIFSALYFRFRRPILPILVLLVASLALTLELAGSTAAFFLPATRLWELMVGGALAQRGAAPPTSRAGARLAAVGACLGLLAIVAAVLVIDRQTVFPGWWTLLPVGGAALIVAAGDGVWVNRVVLSNRALVFVGLISYPLYLWHWTLLSFARTLASGEVSIALRVSLVSASVVMAALTYFLVEKPFRSGPSSTAKPLMLGIAMVVIAVMGAAVRVADGFPGRYRGDARALADLTTYDTTATYPCVDELRSFTPALGYCKQSAASPPTIALFGDSHAEHLFAGIKKLDPETSWLLVGHPSCPPVVGVNVKNKEEWCQKRSERILEYLVATTAIHTVVLSYFDNYILDTNLAADHVHNRLGPRETKITSEMASGSKAELFYFGLNDTVTTLEKSGKQVIVILDEPELPFMPRECLVRIPGLANRATNCSVSRAMVQDRQVQARALVRRLSVAHPTIRVFDPLDAVCDRGECPVRDGDGLLYRDSHHLSLRGGERVAQAFLGWLRQP